MVLLIEVHGVLLKASPVGRLVQEILRFKRAFMEELPVLRMELHALN